jgi:hypothetical protein
MEKSLPRQFFNVTEGRHGEIRSFTVLIRSNYGDEQTCLYQ